MKRLVKSDLHSNRTSVSFLHTYLIVRSIITILCSLALILILSLSTGCTKEMVDDYIGQEQTSKRLFKQPAKNVLTEYDGLPWQTTWELP